MIGGPRPRSRWSPTSLLPGPYRRFGRFRTASDDHPRPAAPRQFPTFEVPSILLTQRTASSIRSNKKASRWMSWERSSRTVRRQTSGASQPRKNKEIPPDDRPGPFLPGAAMSARSPGFKRPKFRTTRFIEHGQVLQQDRQDSRRSRRSAPDAGGRHRSSGAALAPRRPGLPGRWVPLQGSTPARSPPTSRPSPGTAAARPHIPSVWATTPSRPWPGATRRA